MINNNNDPDIPKPQFTSIIGIFLYIWLFFCASGLLFAIAIYGIIRPNSIENKLVSTDVNWSSFQAFSLEKILVFGKNIDSQKEDFYFLNLKPNVKEIYQQRNFQKYYTEEFNIPDYQENDHKPLLVQQFDQILSYCSKKKIIFFDFSDNLQCFITIGYHHKEGFYQKGVFLHDLTQGKWQILFSTNLKIKKISIIGDRIFLLAKINNQYQLFYQRISFFQEGYENTILKTLNKNISLLNFQGKSYLLNKTPSLFTHIPQTQNPQTFFFDSIIQINQLFQIKVENFDEKQDFEVCLGLVDTQMSETRFQSSRGQQEGTVVCFGNQEFVKGQEDSKNTQNEEKKLIQGDVLIVHFIEEEILIYNQRKTFFKSIPVYSDQEFVPSLHFSGQINISVSTLFQLEFQNEDQIYRKMFQVEQNKENDSVIDFVQYKQDPNKILLLCKKSFQVIKIQAESNISKIYWNHVNFLGFQDIDLKNQLDLELNSLSSIKGVQDQSYFLLDIYIELYGKDSSTKNYIVNKLFMIEIDIYQNYFSVINSWQNSKQKMCSFQSNKNYQIPGEKNLILNLGIQEEDFEGVRSLEEAQGIQGKQLEEILQFKQSLKRFKKLNFNSDSEQLLKLADSSRYYFIVLNTKNQLDFYPLDKLVFPYFAATMQIYAYIVIASLTVGFLICLCIYFYKYYCYKKEIYEEKYGLYAPKTFASLISQIPNIEENVSECSICWETIQKEQEVRLTICYHVFHENCFQKWFLQKQTCPYCYQNLHKSISKDKKTILNFQKKNSYIQSITNNKKKNKNHSSFPIQTTQIQLSKQNSAESNDEFGLIQDTKNKIKDSP